MKTRLLCVFFAAALLATLLTGPAAAGGEKKPAKDSKENAVFKLQEASVFDGEVGQTFLRGEYAQCSTTPFKEVKAYPKLKSKQPLYGKLQFDRSLTNREGTAIYFVLDESGETPPAAEKTDMKETQEKASRSDVPPVMTPTTEGKTDAKNAKGKKPDKRHAVSAKLSSYDRLYLDANRDGDLTNDPVLKPMKDPPWKFFPGYEYKERMAFESANIGVDYGPGVGVRPFPIFAWFMVTGDEKRPTALRCTAVAARKGTIRLGKDEYDATLMQEFTLTGRFDRPITALNLTPKGSGARLPSYGFESNLLMSMRRCGDQFYTITASPLGDEVTVKPYRGPFGVLKIGPGGRKLKDFSFQGSFCSESTAICVGPDNGDRKKVTECKLPVGDYLPSYLTIDYDGLQISLSDNYHSEGHPRDMQKHRAYGIRIREGKPFVFDFSNKPKIVFASPATDKPVKRGDEVNVAAVLVDPKLDIMIRRLTDPSKTKKETVKYRVGKEMKEYTYERPLSLDPTVTITNSAGKKVAEGVLPFG
jgi:hypothetical protein